MHVCVCVLWELAQFRKEKNTKYNSDSNSNLGFSKSIQQVTELFWASVFLVNTCSFECPISAEDRDGASLISYHLYQLSTGSCFFVCLFFNFNKLIDNKRQ